MTPETPPNPGSGTVSATGENGGDCIATAAEEGRCHIDPAGRYGTEAAPTSGTVAAPTSRDEATDGAIEGTDRGKRHEDPEWMERDR